MFNKSYGMPIPEISSNELSSKSLCNKENLVLFEDTNIQHTFFFNELIDNNT